MRNELRIELYRARKSKWTWIVLVIGLAISTGQFLLVTVPLRNNTYTGVYPLSVFAKWMGGENTSAFSALYYFILPILAAIPYGGSFKEDIQGGYIRQMMIRSKRKSYYSAKYIAVFLSAGCIAVIPLLFNFMLTALILPCIKPQANTALFPLFSYSMLGDLFYSSPFLYLAIYFLINFVYIGLLGTLSLLATYICDNIFTVPLVPFFLYLFLYALTQITGHVQLCPYGFLRPSQPIAANPVILLCECAIMAALGGIYFYVGKKQEIL